MKKQKKLSIKVRDLMPLKDVTGGRYRVQGHAYLHLRGEGGGGNSEPWDLFLLKIRSIIH
ncbi:MAG TPA: hypothetical protein VKE29_06855 [Candidatus Udaeobacter sp.]|nr:hypothetical protein [Candidatus Udaeobacter sp.]